MWERRLQGDAGVGGWVKTIPSRALGRVAAGGLAEGGSARASVRWLAASAASRGRARREGGGTGSVGVLDLIGEKT
jgi:hypothetical protein